MYFEEMKRRGLVKEGTVGNANVQVFKMGDCRRVLEEFLAGKVENFAGCKGCSIRPRVVPATVPSDWDEERKRVRPDTTAFIGDVDL